MSRMFEFFFQTQEIVYDHLLIQWIMGSYVHCIYHGEQSQMRDTNESIYSEDENDKHVTMMEFSVH